MFKYKKYLSILDGTQHSSVSSSKQCIIPDPNKALECKFRLSLVDFFLSLVVRFVFKNSLSRSCSVGPVAFTL